MPRIFTDSVDKSAFYIYVISRNKLPGLGKGYSNLHLVVPKYLVSNISKSKPFSSMFLGSFGSQIFQKN